MDALVVMEFYRRNVTFFADDEFDVTDESDDPSDHEFMVFLISLAFSKWPFDLERPYLHSSSLPIGSINSFAQSADSSSLEAVTRLNRISFEILLKPFSEIFNRPFQENSGEKKGRLQQRKISAPGGLVLALHFLAHAPSLCSLCLFTGAVMSTTSRYLTLALKILQRCLQECSEGSLDLPGIDYLRQLGDLSTTVFGHDCMQGCIIVTDGSMHALEKDAAANSNFFYDEKHPDYNGWKGCYCKKGNQSTPYFFLTLFKLHLRSLLFSP